MQREKLDKEKIKDIYKNYECNHIDRIVNVLGMYRQGEYIYPDVIQRNLKVTKKEAFEILEMLRDAGMVEVCFQYFCTECGRPVGAFVTEDNSNEDFYCPECDSLLNKKLKWYAYKCI